MESLLSWKTCMLDVGGTLKLFAMYKCVVVVVISKSVSLHWRYCFPGGSVRWRTTRISSRPKISNPKKTPFFMSSGTTRKPKGWRTRRGRFGWAQATRYCSLFTLWPEIVNQNTVENTHTCINLECKLPHLHLCLGGKIQALGWFC